MVKPSKECCLTCNGSLEQSNRIVLRCRVCRVAVHKTCCLADYASRADFDNWVCYSCKNCELCGEKSKFYSEDVLPYDTLADFLYCRHCTHAFHHTCLKKNNYTVPATQKKPPFLFTCPDCKEAMAKNKKRKRSSGTKSPSVRKQKSKKKDSVVSKPHQPETEEDTSDDEEEAGSNRKPYAVSDFEDEVDSSKPPKRQRKERQQTPELPPNDEDNEDVSESHTSKKKSKAIPKAESSRRNAKRKATELKKEPTKKTQQEAKKAKTQKHTVPEDDSDALPQPSAKARGKKPKKTSHSASMAEAPDEDTFDSTSSSRNHQYPSSTPVSHTRLYSTTSSTTPLSVNVGTSSSALPTPSSESKAKLGPLLIHQLVQIKNILGDGQDLNRNLSVKCHNIRTNECKFVRIAERKLESLMAKLRERFGIQHSSIKYLRVKVNTTVADIESDDDVCGLNNGEVLEFEDEQ